MFKAEKLSGKNIEGNEELDNLKKLSLYIVRHGNTKYLENDYVAKFGKWAPDIYDLKEGEVQHITKTAESIIKELDPKKHILVILTSPRARTQRTREILEKTFRQEGFDIYGEGKNSIVEILRSGGDDSPVVGPENEITTREGVPISSYDIWAEGEEKNEGGKRLKQFMAFFAAVDKKKLIEAIKEDNLDFHGKIPVFVSVTHGELPQGESYYEESYKKSLMGIAFPEYKLIELERGEKLKIDFDLDNPGHLELTIPPEVSKRGMQEKRKLIFDQSNGSLEIDKSK